MIRSVVAGLGVGTALMILFPSSAGANNPYGIMAHHSGGHDSTWVSYYLGQAARLCGQWGYTRTGGGPGSASSTKRNLIMHRASQLIPIVNVGSSRSAADIAAFVQAMRNDGYTMPYIEIGNEMQGSWPAADYAAYLLAVCQAVKAVVPDTQIMNGGFAGSGDEYLDDMFTAVPALVDELDIVCCHPYSINYPPADPRGFLAYLKTVAVMDAHGFTGPIAFTEFGYELGNHGNPQYPMITEQLRAAYMVDIFQNYIEQDARILAACPFILGDQLWNAWALWDWLRFDRTVTDQFDAIAALPKPPGDDYLPTGTASLTGTVIDPGLTSGVHDVFVYLLPGPYAVRTQANGLYRIKNIPPGTYTLGLLKDGYQSPNPTQVNVSTGTTMDLAMPRLGVFRDAFDWEGTNGVSPGWTPADGQNHSNIFSIDLTNKHSGRASQKMDTGGPMIWKASNYNSIFTGEVWHAEVWVRTQGLIGPGRQGAFLQIDFRDNHFSFVGNTGISTGIVPDQDWTLLAMTFVVPEDGRRMQVQIGCDAEDGSVWFDDIIVDRADAPVATWIQSPADRITDDWNLISVPMRPRDPDADSVFDELSWSGMTVNDNLYRYQEGIGYETCPDDFTATGVDRGYWLRLDAPTIETVAGHRVAGDLQIALDDGWTLIGYPFLTGQPWSNCRVTDGGPPLSIADAADAGWLQSKAYYYDDRYRLVGADPPAHDTMLRPWYAYYVRAFQTGLSLIIPDPSGSGALQGTVHDEFGQPLDGAVISATPGGYWAMSDAGTYQITGIPEGAYDVRVTAAECVTQTAGNHVIAPDQTTELNFILDYVTYPTEVQNPGFENGEALPGWTRFGVVDGQQSGPWYGGIIPHSGNYFLGSASNYSGNNGGVYQKLSVTPGVNYTASVWVAVYWSGGTPEERGCRIGIDPTGNHDPASADIVWSDWSTEYDDYTWSWKYVEVTGVSATTPRSLMTVYLEQKQRPGGIWNITCFDDVSFVAESPPPAALSRDRTSDAGGVLSYCEFVIESLSAGDWASTFLAVVDSAASDGHVPGEDLAFIPPPGKGVAMLSMPAGGAEDCLLDARDGVGDQQWFGGDASGADQTLVLKRFGYASEAPPVSVRITWNLQAASDWRYVLYHGGGDIELTPGGNYLVDVGDAGITLRLLADGSPLPIPPDFDGDNDVDQADFGHLQACFSGAAVPQTDPDCRDAWLDTDDDVDADDYSLFRACMNGPNVPFDPACKKPRL